MQKMKLILADDEPYICELLVKLIDFDTLGLVLLACVHDGETLEREIEEQRPDIVLTDISMPKRDGLEVVRSTREKGIECRFVIISGYRQFEYAHNALRYNVDDYLLKPVEQSELNMVLKKLCGEIRQSFPDTGEAESVLLHTELMERGIYEELSQNKMTLSQVNQRYRTAFRDGYFQFFMLKLDFSRDEKQRMEDISSIVNKLRNIGYQNLRESCFEMVSADKRDGIIFLINYGKEQGETIKKQLHELYIEAKNIIDLFQGFNLTVSVGAAVEALHQLETAAQSCEQANWLRMYYGVNRLIYADPVGKANSGSLRPQLNKIWEELEKGYTAIDLEMVKRAFYRLFALPSTMLRSMECMLFTRDCISRFCEIYGTVTKTPANVQKASVEIDSKVNFQTSFPDYEMALIGQIEEYMLEMAEIIRKKHTKPVLKAYDYIEQHYSEQLTLEKMAQIVNLNPVYFSSLFKKESGQNFTEYLTGFRMMKAKEMLRKGDKNISEIADALGYLDARYFSKVFKKNVGIKPTDYRKIYG